jgi:hypothetical protein
MLWCWATVKSCLPRTTFIAFETHDGRAAIERSEHAELSIIEESSGLNCKRLQVMGRCPQDLGL